MARGVLLSDSLKYEYFADHARKFAGVLWAFPFHCFDGDGSSDITYQ
jgi:hypothetical protein